MFFSKQLSTNWNPHLRQFLNDLVPFLDHHVVGNVVFLRQVSTHHVAVAHPRVVHNGDVEKRAAAWSARGAQHLRSLVKRLQKRVKVLRLGWIDVVHGMVVVDDCSLCRRRRRRCWRLGGLRRYERNTRAFLDEGVQRAKRAPVHDDAREARHFFVNIKLGSDTLLITMRLWLFTLVFGVGLGAAVYSNYFSEEYCC